MHYKNTLLLAYASLTLLVSADPQAGGAAASGAVAQSTLTHTMVATATIGGTDPAAATGAATVRDGSDANDSTGASTGGTMGGPGAAGGGGVGASGALGSSSGNINAAAAAAAAGGNPGAGVGAAAGAGARMGSGMPSGFNNGASGFPDSKDGPPAGFWQKHGGVADGDRAQLWSKFSADTDHPHQPVARGWSNWFGRGANKGQDNGMGSGNKQRHARAVLARDVFVNGGPSWNDVRSGDVGTTNVVARSVAKDGMGWAGNFEGPMGYDGKRQGGQRWGGLGQ